MKLLVTFALVCVVGFSVGEASASIELDYHNKIGIPAAASIKVAEETQDFDNDRIVGGTAAALGQYPYLGGLVITLTTGQESVCGSSLISNTRAVTAAHCWRTSNSQARQFVVVLGSITIFSGGTRIPTSDVEIHANYDMTRLVNDVAIIRLNWVTYTIQESVCGSSLISNTRAVTAAHCWRTSNSQARQFVVVLGSITIFSGGTRIPTSDVEIHANYDMTRLVNDVAIIRLNWVTYTNNIRNIALFSGSNLLVGTWAWAAGFGRTSDSFNGAINSWQTLSHIQVQVITNAICEASYGNVTVQASTLCTATTGPRATCGGDSGGPLVVNNQLIGIISFGHANGCYSSHPNGYARVSSFAPWIWARM